MVLNRTVHNILKAINYRRLLEKLTKLLKAKRITPKNHRLSDIKLLEMDHVKGSILNDEE